MKLKILHPFKQIRTFSKQLLFGLVFLGLLVTPMPTQSSDFKTRDKLKNQLTPAEKKWLAEHPVITIAGPRSFPPFHYFENGELKGISADYLNTIARQLGVKLRVLKDLPWPEVLEMAKVGKIDLVGCIGKTANRKNFLDFSESYLSFPLVIISSNNAPFIGGIEDLQGKKISLVSKILTEEWLRRDGIEFIPHYVNSPLEGLREISFGRADAGIENLAAATYMIQKNGLSNLKIAAPTPYENYHLYMAVPKDRRELLSIVNKALEAIPPQQNMDIRNQWLSVRYEYGISKKDVIRYVAIVALFALGILIVVLIWNRRLKKETIDRTITEAALKESEGKLRNIVENSTNMYYSHTADHRLTYISPQCREFLQCEPEEAMTRWTEFATDNPINKKGMEHTEKAIQTGKRQPPYELELIGKKGKKILVEVRENPVVVEGKTVAIVGSLTDITKRKKAEDEKEELRSQLIQAHKMEAVGTLAGGIAHDFNNILGIILGNTELAILDLPEWNPARSNLKEIRTASMRAREVVRQLLSFTRKTEQERRPLNIQQLVEESIQLLRASIPSSIDIRFQTVGPIQPIVADPTQIQQVIINLSTNAAQAMSPEGGTLTILIEQVKTDALPNMPSGDKRIANAVRLTIEDTGKGIDPVIRDRIFDPYFTTKEVGKGSGLGLAIVHGIVRNHDGHISVSSNPGRGTRFSIFFPVSEDPLLEERPPKTDQTPTGSERILLVDDEVSLLNMMQQLLERLGYAVEARHNPGDALRLFSMEPDQFDLVITDMTMPRLTGTELARQLKKIRADIPVIICTGHSEQIDKESDEKLGISALIMKPVTSSETAATVRAVLDGADITNPADETEKK